MLLANRFDISSELSESLAENSDNPSHATLEHEEVSILECVCDCTDWDDLVIRALKELNNEQGLCSDKWQEKDGLVRLVLYWGKIYIPRDNQLRLNIVKSHHNYPVAGHPRWWKTTELIMHNFWWPRMGHYVVDYVKGCDFAIAWNLSSIPHRKAHAQ